MEPKFKILQDVVIIDTTGKIVPAKIVAVSQFVDDSENVVLQYGVSAGMKAMTKPEVEIFNSPQAAGIYLVDLFYSQFPGNPWHNDNIKNP